MYIGANVSLNLGQIKKISVFQGTGLKISGKVVTVGTHTFFNYFFFWNFFLILCIFKGEMPFKMHKINFFPENLKKILGFTSKFR